MTCPNNVAAGSFLMDSLVGGSSPYRGEGYSANSGMYMQTTADYGCSMMRNFGILGAPLSKRDELPPASLSLSPYHHSHYLSQRDSWGTGAKTYRNGQPVAQSLHPCSFTTSNVKEEEIACVYQSESDRSKDSNETSTYIRLGDNTRQADQSTIAAHDYFRGGQVYSTQGGTQGGGFGTDFSTMPRITSPVENHSSDESVKKSKSKQGTADEDMKAEENDTSQRQPRKEENGPKIDSCTDESDNELKGESLKPIIAQSVANTHSLSHFYSLYVSLFIQTQTHTVILTRCLHPIGVTTLTKW